MSDRLVAHDRRVAVAWRVAVVVASAVVGWLLIVQGLDPFFGPAYDDRFGHAVRAVLATAFAVPLVVVARRRLDRRPWSGLALTGLRAGWRPLLFGMAFWLVAAAAGTAASVALGWARITVGPMDGGMLLLAIALPVLVFLYEALPEELLFRGYVYRNLSDRLARWVAVAGQAALFTVWGVLIGAAVSVERVVLFFTFSLVLGVIRVITGNLWACIGFHLAFQVVTQFLSAAVRDGAVQVEGFLDLEFVAFWFVPIVLGSIGLVVASLVSKRTSWAEHDPDLADPPAGAPTRE